MPMKNGDLDSKGFLASIIQAEGTIESFKVSILLCNVEVQMTSNIIFIPKMYCQILYYLTLSSIHLFSWVKGFCFSGFHTSKSQPEI